MGSDPHSRLTQHFLSNSKNELPLEFFKVIVEHMNEGLWIGDQNHHTRYVNPAFERLFGYEPGEWLGKHSYSYFDEKNAEIVKQANQVRKKGLATQYEVEVLSKYGKPIPVLMSGAPTPDGGTVGIMTDLRKTDFGKLKETEERYRQLVELMNEGVRVGDMLDRALYANPAYLKMLGYTLEEILGKDGAQFFAPESQEILKFQNTLRAKSKESHYEALMLSKTGEKIPVLIHGVPFTGGTIATITDLRPMKRLEKSERVFQMYAQYSIDAMVGLNKEDIVQEWNVGAERMFGWNGQEMIGKSISCIIPPEKIQAGELDYLFSEVRKKGFVRNHETIRLHKNGSPIAVSLTYTLIRDQKGKEIGYSAVYRDITMQKNSERELQKRFDKMHESYNEMGKLRRYISYLLDLLDFGSVTSDDTHIPQFIANAILMFSTADAVIMRRYNAEKDSLDLLATAGAVQDWEKKGSLPFKGSLAEKTFETKRSVKVLDIMQEPLYSNAIIARKNNLRSLILIPLLVRKEALGTVSVYISSDKSLDILDHEFIPIFAKQAAQAMKLSQLL